MGLIIYNFNTWAAITHQPGNPGDETAFHNDMSHYNNKQVSDSLLSYDKAPPSHSLTVQLTLYEYDVDRKQAQREV